MNIINITNQIPKGNYKVGRDGYKPIAIVCHITGDSDHQCVTYFKNPSSGVSAHFVIERNGALYMCVDPINKAYHAGIINQPRAQIYFDMENENPNAYTIGIECTSNGESLTKIQYKILKELIAYLCKNYNIPLDRYHIIGHYELDAIDRAFDPISSYSVDKLVEDVKQEEVLTVKDLVENLNELRSALKIPNSNWAKDQIVKAKNDGLIKNDHDTEELVTFGIFMTVMNNAMIEIKKFIVEEIKRQNNKV